MFNRYEDPDRAFQHPSIITGNPRVAYCCEVVAWMVLIMYLSGESFAASRTLIALQYRVASLDLTISAKSMLLIQTVLRKGAHFAEFFVLGILSYRALSGSLVDFRFRTAYWVLVARLPFSIGDEVRQVFSVGRAASFRDSALDFAGVLTSQLWIFHRSPEAIKKRNAGQRCSKRP